MKNEIIVTGDGSHSINVPETGNTYHSTHGAIQESQHVFLQAGLEHLLTTPPSLNTIAVLEMGFGTGLNALLTIAAAEKYQIPVYYETLEKFPLDAITFNALNYCDRLNRPDLLPLYQLMHTCKWNEQTVVSRYFQCKKLQIDIVDFVPDRLFNVIYFDAFAPEKQPELWTVAIFQKLYDCMEPNGVLTTYCSKSSVRKAMQEAGWRVEKIPGPPHKREIVRATKP